GRRKQNCAIAGNVREQSAKRDRGLARDQRYRFREANHPRRRGRHHSKTKDVDLRTGGQNTDRGARFRDRAKDQVLHFCATPAGGKFSEQQLSAIKSEVAERLAAVWEFIERDVQSRLK